MAKKKAAKRAANKGKQAAPKNKLIIEYMGICSFVWQKSLGPKAKKQEAEVWLVDVGATGRARHYPCLTVSTEAIARGSRANDPDIVVAVPNLYAEFGGWDLSQAVLEIKSDRTSHLEAKYRKLSAQELRKFPMAEPENLDWLANLGEVTGTVSVKQAPPVVARVTNVKGRITPLDVGKTGNSVYTFKEGSTVIGTAKRYLAWHFQQEIGYDNSVTIEIVSAARGGREIRIIAPKPGDTADRRITIGNLCRCADDGNADHFYSFYDLLEGGQTPIIIDETAKVLVPGDEEHCGGTIIIDPST